MSNPDQSGEHSSSTDGTVVLTDGTAPSVLTEAARFLMAAAFDPTAFGTVMAEWPVTLSVDLGTLLVTCDRCVRAQARYVLLVRPAPATLAPQDLIQVIGSHVVMAHPQYLPAVLLDPPAPDTDYGFDPAARGDACQAFPGCQLPAGHLSLCDVPGVHGLEWRCATCVAGKCRPHEAPDGCLARSPFRRWCSCPRRAGRKK